MIGRLDSDVIVGTLSSVLQHDLRHEVLSSTQIKEKFHVFNLEDNEVGVYEADAGYLVPELCVMMYQKLAIENGAILQFNESVVHWKSIKISDFLLDSKNKELCNIDPNFDEIIEVKTDLDQTYYCYKLVLSVGPWAPEMYGSRIPLKLTVERRVLFWIEPVNLKEEYQVRCVVIVATHQKG
jgi:sarcosine oxidase